MLLPIRPRSNGGNGSDCQLLFHANGTNGSTTFTDSSPAARGITAAGTAQLSTTQKKFGDTSFTPGTGAAVIADSASIELGSGDFTFDCWVYPTATSLSYLLGKAANDSAYSPLYITLNTSWAISASSNGTSADVFGAVSLGNATANQWQHIAVTRSGTSFYGFLNGVKTNLATSSATLVNNADSWRIGNYSATLLFPISGYIDEVRFIIGKAAWTADFPVKLSPWG